MSESSLPLAVVLHDRLRSDYSPVVRNANLDLPFRVASFTDTHPARNPHNEDLGMVVSEADYLFIQASLLRPLTFDAQTIIVGSGHASGLTAEVFTFDNDYQVSGLRPEALGNISLRRSWNE